MWWCIRCSCIITEFLFAGRGGDDAFRNGKSIVDNMMLMMERYQMKLEDLVDEKTEQLMMEKQKTDNLLHRMLPP